MKRSVARECALRTIYSKLFNNEFDGVEASEDLIGKYDESVYSLIIDYFTSNYADLTEIIKANLINNMTIDRIYKVDLALIYLALSEINTLKTPNKIVINEIVELAKKYSTDKSYKFINGFLASYINK